MSEVRASLRSAAPERLRAAEAGAADLAWCDALLLATPENFGFMSGAMKEFLDRTFYAASAQQLNRAFALIISAGVMAMTSDAMATLMRFIFCSVLGDEIRSTKFEIRNKHKGSKFK